MVTVEIVRMQKEADAAAHLVADRPLLAFAIGDGEEQAAFARTFRTHHHPALVGVQRDILDEIEAEFSAVKSDARL